MGCLASTLRVSHSHGARYLGALAILTILAGCATTRPTTTRVPPPTSSPSSPSASEKAVFQRGKASYYADSFDGQRTASGEIYSPQQLTAAHRTLAFGTRVRVTDVDNDRHVTVRINDRGPFKSGRIIDLSQRAAKRLHMTDDGTTQVTLTIVSRPKD